MITNADLHYTLIKEIIEKGYAPSIPSLSELLDDSRDEVVRALYALQDDHGVVLHPHEPKVWVIHPFSLAPTNFYVRSSKGEWWGNCAWCSLGIAALIKDDVIISSSVGAETERIEINIVDGVIQETDYLVHFPIAMKHAWDNVIYTCSNMLFFEKEDQVVAWTRKHNIPMGDVQPIENIWNFSKQWYGNHLNPNWKKWTIDEAKQLFATYNLTGATRDLGDAKERF